MHAELKVVEGKQQGAVIPLAVKKFLIGRGEDCQLRPNSDSVSRHHCVFSLDEFTVRLRDLGSTNGTFVNGERLTGQRVLETGDKIRIGKLVFEIAVYGKVPEVAQAASAPEPAYVAPEASSSDTMVDYHVEPEVTDDASATAVFSGDTQMIPPTKKKKVANPIPIRLPDPASTGAKPPEPAPTSDGATDGSAPVEANPRQAAADIIRQARSRRPI